MIDKETQELIDEMLAEEQQAMLQDEYDEQVENQRLEQIML